MADVHEFSDRVIDLAERLSNVADAAAGRHRASGVSPTRWFLLPAAGAGLYALARSEFVARKAKGAVNGAKTRASELQDELIDAVRQTSQESTSRSGGQRRRQTTSPRKTKSGR
jgi:hypothetical protein